MKTYTKWELPDGAIVILLADHLASLEEKDEELIALDIKYAKLDLETNEQIAALTAELESHAWEISPAMAQAKIDELTATSAKQATEIGRLKNVLKEFRALVKGECPSLLPDYTLTERG